MMRTRVLWTAWGLLPVFAAAYHFGPGQQVYLQNVASGTVEAAQRVEAAAQAAQDKAYELHLATLDAKKHAADGPEGLQKYHDAQAAESAAYAAAAESWSKVAEAMQSAIDTLARTSPRQVQNARWARDRALIRAGKIESGVSDLEDLVESLTTDNGTDSQLARDAREELATGYYYKARLMRMAGAKGPEWREVSAKARQNFRYLAESGKERGESPEMLENYQKNVELVLNLEQSAASELEAKPLPKNSPQGNREGNKPGKGKRPGKRPGKGPDKDARGAGGLDDIGPGW
jgi:hypothetical protein